MNEIKLQIYIMCCDRPGYAIKAIQSVIESADFNTEVIISDNSETDCVANMCRENFPSIRYIRRSSPRTGAAHYKSILDEAKSEYLVMFHDDDLMTTDYVTTLLPYIQANPTVSAVGCNAEIIDKNDNLSGSFFLSNLKAPLCIFKSYDFIYPYLVGNFKYLVGDFGSPGIVPFPSYMYRREHVCSSFVNDSHGGKYGDVAFLHKILLRAPIVWHNCPLINYRFHGGNDSAVESLSDRLSLLRYLFSNGVVDRRSIEVKYFKFASWMNWWIRNHDSINFFIPNGSRERVVFHFLAVTAIKLILINPVFRKVILRKTLSLVKATMVRCRMTSV
jgi:hypothetical protein